MSAPLAVHMTGSEWFGAAPGGLPRYFSGLFAALRADADVTVTAAAFGDAEEGGRSWGPTGGGLPGRVRASRRRAAAGIDVLDRHFALYGPPPRGAALVTHFHGPWASESAASGQHRAAVAVKQAVEARRYRRSARLVVLSRAFADLLVGRYGVPAADVAVIAPGVDLDRFTAAPVPDGPPRVLCVRRLEHRMGLDVLLDAWPAVRAAVPDAQLDVVGTGSLHDALAARTRTSTAPSSVTLHGALDEDALAHAYRRSTVTVVPTRALEGFGLIALESLAAGRAPVVTDVGGLPDGVRGLAPDLVVAPEDPAALAARLVAALRGERPDVAACRAHAESFTWAACARTHVAMYRELVA